ncbi:MAG: hypothetical protein JRJ31_03185, partial [Deltaproteobacteria bacterium]|nr:hypothetical protein [Deltaproteobacteria bacterium]
MPSMEKLHTWLKGKDFVMMAVDLQEPAPRVKKFFQDHKLRVIGMAVGAREWDSRHSLRMFEYLLDHEGVLASSG